MAQVRKRGGFSHRSPCSDVRLALRGPRTDWNDLYSICLGGPRPFSIKDLLNVAIIAEHGYIRESQLFEIGDSSFEGTFLQHIANAAEVVRRVSTLLIWADDSDF